MFATENCHPFTRHAHLQDDVRNILKMAFFHTAESRKKSNLQVLYGSPCHICLSYRLDLETSYHTLQATAL